MNFRYLIAIAGCLSTVGFASAASAATYSDQATFLAANPGLDLVSFSGLTASLELIYINPYDGVTFAGTNLYFVDTSFWGSVDSLLDNTFNGFLTADFAASDAIGFFFASNYGDGTFIDFTAYNGATEVFTETLIGGGVETSFSYFGLDGVGPITSIRLDSSPYAGGFASIAEISVGEAAVPEPASWALFIAGFGMVGAAVRRRKSVSAA